MVKTVWSEILLRIDRDCREIGMATKDGNGKTLLVDFLQMRELVQAPGAAGRTVDAEVLQAANSVLKAANKLVPHTSQLNGKACVDKLAPKLEDYLRNDPGFALDYGLVVQCGSEAGLQKLRERCLAPLPTAVGDHNVAVAVNQLTLVKQSAAYKFVDSTAKGQVNLCHEVVSSLGSNRCPNYAAFDSSEFMAAVKDRLQYFVYETKPGENEGAEVELSGADALTHKFQAVSARKAAGQTVSEPEIRIFHTYAWLLTSEQKRQLDAWVQAHWKAVGAPPAKASLPQGPPAKAKAGSASSSSAGPAAKAKAKADSKASTSSFFKKKTS